MRAVAISKVRTRDIISLYTIHTGLEPYGDVKLQMDHDKILEYQRIWIDFERMQRELADLHTLHKCSTSST